MQYRRNRELVGLCHLINYQVAGIQLLLGAMTSE